MGIDPNDYDLAELRRLSETPPDGANGGESDGPFDGMGAHRDNEPRSRTSLRSNVLEQLFYSQSAVAGGDRSKPYLESLPENHAGERLVFEWLEFLVLKTGFKRTMEALRYYARIGWVTGDVESELQEYLHGFPADPDDPARLDVDDHMVSLVFVAKLAALD